MANSAAAPAQTDNAMRFEAFRRAVMADAEMQAQLSQPQDSVVFIDLAIMLAGARGLALAPDDLWPHLQPDPLGLSRWSAPEAPSSDWAPPGWLPTAIVGGTEPYLDWAHFGGARLAEPFYEDSLRRARSQPFNRAFRHCTRLSDLAASAPVDAARTPDGLIFHMSRCGSTLAAQMLAADAANVVVSEPAPVDTAVQLETADPSTYAGLLKAVVGAMGRPRLEGERRLFLKLDSWHATCLPLFRQAFPDTPWVFLYRDPREVMVSQMRQRGMQAVRGLLGWDAFGIAADVGDDEYCAMALARTCEAALSSLELGGGLLVNYADLPGAVESQILRHFGARPSAGARARMAAAALRDAKSPERAYTSDSGRGEASQSVAALVSRHLAEPYRQLEALRFAHR